MTATAQPETDAALLARTVEAIGPVDAQAAARAAARQAQLT